LPDARWCSKNRSTLFGEYIRAAIAEAAFNADRGFERDDYRYSSTCSTCVMADTSPPIRHVEHAVPA
jgi:hypothetical protein